MLELPKIESLIAHGMHVFVTFVVWQAILLFYLLIFSQMTDTLALLKILCSELPWGTPLHISEACLK